jgi:ligand-binding sensor domain-containing protein
MVEGEIVNALFVIAVLFGRITEWEHFPHYGGGNGIITRGDVVLSATSGGLLFSHYSEEKDNLVADSGWTCPGKLSYDRVSHVVYDDAGNLWVSMNGGGIDVFAPDGGKTSFNQIDGLPLNLGIKQTLPDSVIYAATTQGLCIRKVGFFEIYNTLSSGGGIPSDNITCLSSSDSGLYVGTTAGLVFLPRSADPGQGSSWVLQSIDAVSVIAMERQNDTLWVATASGLFFKAPGEPWTQNSLFPGGNIASLAWGAGGLAVGCTDHCFILNSGEWHTYSDNIYGSILTGIVWRGNRLYGVLASPYADNRLSGAGTALLRENGRWRRNIPDFGPASNDIRDCTILPDGSVWVSTNRAGASVLAHGQWQQLGRYMTDVNQNFAICPSGSGVFVSSIGHGIDWLSWQNDTVTRTIHLTANDGLLNSRVFCAEEGSANVVWFGHRTLEETETSGVCRLLWSPGDSSSIMFRSITGANGLPSKEVNAVFPTGKRYCWVGTDGGLARVDMLVQSVRETYTSQDGLPSSLVTSLAMDRSGTLYIGTASGLAYLSNDIVTKVSEISCGIKALECDGFGSVWISTDEGLKRYFRASGEVEKYTSFNSPLADGTIYSITVDSNRGNLWMATDHGFWLGHLGAGLSGDGSSAVVYPDPFIPGRGDVLGVAGIPDDPAEISIYDLTGNLVYSYSSAGRSDIAWDGLNTNGNPAASGIYYLRMQQSGRDSSLLKFALVR